MNKKRDDSIMNKNHVIIMTILCAAGVLSSAFIINDDLRFYLTVGFIFTGLIVYFYGEKTVKP